MEVVFARLFLKDLQNISDKKLKSEVVQAIEEFESAQSLLELSNIKKMRGYSEAYRLRIGKYRLSFYCDGLTVKLARFVKRETIYKLFP
ncbi:plasmid stabilization protein [Flavobacterium sp. FZUC8N2.13]|uniref:Plasmid stabilization protein n=1 Tax=Flavobacterium zubiriense TaxID=3138075 RepID=A0ABV4T7S9_9FLAO